MASCSPGSSTPGTGSPSSPRVAKTSTTRCPAAAARASVPPEAMASSSGCAWKETMVPTRRAYAAGWSSLPATRFPSSSYRPAPPCPSWRSQRATRRLHAGTASQPSTAGMPPTRAPRARPSTRSAARCFRGQERRPDQRRHPGAPADAPGPRRHVPAAAHEEEPGREADPAPGQQRRARRRRQQPGDQHQPRDGRERHRGHAEDTTLAPPRTSTTGMSSTALAPAAAQASGQSAACTGPGRTKASTAKPPAACWRAPPPRPLRTPRGRRAAPPGRRSC